MSAPVKRSNGGDLVVEFAHAVDLVQPAEIEDAGKELRFRRMRRLRFQTKRNS